MKIWVYFQAFKNSRSGKHQKNLKLKVSVSEKKNSAPIPIAKLDIGFGTETWFWLESKVGTSVCQRYANFPYNSKGDPLPMSTLG